MLCKKCGLDKDLMRDFYTRSAPCKECTKAAVRANRAAKLEQYQAYDRSRQNEPHRVAARASYQMTDAYKAARPDVLARYENKHPLRKQANTAVSNAVRDGRLVRLPCQVCGRDAEAHHPDYSNFLGVVWLCVDHHAQLHAEHREYIRLQS